MKKILLNFNWKTFVKWSSLLIIVGSIIFLILTFSKSLGFSFGNDWETHSRTNNVVSSGDSNDGPGPLQKHTMQVLIAFFGGGGLGVAGALLQKVTKNRLAEVSILGIGSINIFFIYIYAVVLKDKAYGNSIWAHLMPIFLICVSILGTLIVWAISRSRNANKNTFVIVGIALQLLVEALSVFVVNPKELTKGDAKSEGAQTWSRIQGYTLGKIRSDIKNPYTNVDSNPVPWWLMLLVIGLVLGVLLLVFFLRKKIDTYETSEEIATSTGVNIKRLRLVIYVLVAILAGAASAILGTVALLGIIAPSMARMLFKNKMMPIAIASFLIGGVMVAIASWISLQWEIGIQVGILATAIVVPYFIYQMIRER